MSIEVRKLRNETRMFHDDNIKERCFIGFYNFGGKEKLILLDLAKLELSCHSVEPVNCEMFRRKKLAKVDSLFQ